MVNHVAGDEIREGSGEVLQKLAKLAKVRIDFLTLDRLVERITGESTDDFERRCHVLFDSFEPKLTLYHTKAHFRLVLLNARLVSFRLPQGFALGRAFAMAKSTNSCERKKPS